MAEIPTPTTGYSSPSSDRPLGVTILGILQILGGILSIVAGFGLIALAALMTGLELLFMAIGAMTLILGIVGLIVGWGLYTMKSWAWMIAIILNIINIILAIYPSFNIMSMIIPIIIILYLNQADIKSRFR